MLVQCRRTLAWQTSALALLALSACGGGGTDPNVPVATTTRVHKVAADAPTGTPGQLATPSPAVVVQDSNGNVLSGVPVQFEVLSGGGTITQPTVRTNSAGIAQVGSWVLGSSGTNILQATAASDTTCGNSVTFTAADPTAFNIGIEFLCSPTLAQQQAFMDARARWEQLVRGDLADVQLTAESGECGADSPRIDEVTDDLLILVTVEDIDGPGEVLASAGPCFARTSNDLPVLGAMHLDTADLDDIEAAGLLSATVLHEMGHVLGFGIGGGLPDAPFLWDHFLVDPALTPTGEVIAGADPHFTGPRALAAFDLIGGSAYSGSKVPVENTAQSGQEVGTVDSHWRESVFANELMTGFLGNGPNPLSRVTVASLADLGYVVDEAGADAFALPLASLRVAERSRRITLKNDILRLPMKGVTTRGQVVDRVRR